MLELFKKNPEPETENTIPTQNEQEIPKEIKQTNQELTKTPKVSDLVTSYQKMRAKEQELLEIKQQILNQQNDLQNELLKEIERKKIAISNLVSEIPDLQNRNQQIGQALGVDIYK